MKYYGACLSIFLFGSLCHAKTQSTAVHSSLCKNSEEIYFSCKIINTKTISLCGAKSNDKETSEHTQRKIVFRSGIFPNVEIVYPSQKSNSAINFKGEHFSPYGENLVSDSIFFKENGISQGITIREGQKSFAGLWSADKKSYKEFKCTNKYIQNSFFNLVLELPPP